MLTAADHVVMPWKNGGGTTSEIARHPAGSTIMQPNFAWRISIADIAESCTFSRFDGYDRTLVLVSGTRMILRVGERQPVDLGPYERCDFEGEAAVDCVLPDGPVRDFNVIVARGRVHTVIDVLRAGHAKQRYALRGGTLLLYCRDAAVRITLDDGASFDLNDGDTLHIDPVTPLYRGFDIEPTKKSTSPVLIAGHLTLLKA